MKYGKKFVPDADSPDGIPGEEFESLIMEYLPVTAEQIREYAVPAAYNEKNNRESQAYAWVGLGCGNYAPTFFGTSLPEVTDIKPNADGTVTLTVDAVCDMILCDDAVITHELTVEFDDDGCFRHLGNKILDDGIRKNRNQSRKALDMTFWLVPVIAMLQGALRLLAQDDRAGYPVMSVAMCFGFGLMFLFMGNYLPKIRQNRTLGIKVRWALENEENWNATHRFGGRVWVISGFVCMACGMILHRSFSMTLFAAAVFAAAFLPCIYSWWYYRRQLKEGRAERIRRSPKAVIFSGLFMIAVLAFVLWVLFTGNMNIRYGEQSFTVETKQWENLTVRYQDIEKVVYHPEGLSAGGSEARTDGFGNLKLSMGSFSNDRYGAYTRYTFASCDAYVELLMSNGKIIVINGPDGEATEAIYDALKTRIE